MPLLSRSSRRAPPTLGDDDLENTQARPVAYCVAAQDGVRHLYLGEDGKGYLFHPDMPDWISVLEALHELEKKYCVDWE